MSSIKARRATFTADVVNGKTVFTPVNKRAKQWAAKQKTLERKQLRAIKAAGLRVSVWTDGKLKAAKV